MISGRPTGTAMPPGWFTRYEIIESPLFMDKEGD